MRKFTINDIHDIANKHNGKCLSTEYSGPLNLYSWTCEHMHIWKMSWDEIFQGAWCNACFSIKNNINEIKKLEEMKRIAKIRCGECLSENYVYATTKLAWKCNKCNNEWAATPHKIKTGNWCPKCAKEVFIAFLKTRKQR